MRSNFERCAGCPIVEKGKTCETLQVFVEQAGIDEPGFKKGEFMCPDMLKQIKPMGPSDGEVTITQSGVTFGLGETADFILEQIFG